MPLSAFRFGSGYLVSGPLLVKGFVTFSFRPGFRFGLRNLVSVGPFVKGVPAFVFAARPAYGTVSCLTARLAGRPGSAEGRDTCIARTSRARSFFRARGKLGNFSLLQIAYKCVRHG